MKFGVIVFPASNCDHDVYDVLKHVLHQDVQFLWHKDRALDGCDAIVLPGGFSYGDYLRIGSIARFSPIMQEVIQFAASGKPVIGICNGFQILQESRLLPGAMLRNKTLRFVCKFVYLKVENEKSTFTNKCQPGQLLKIPIAHNEGNFYLEKDELEELENNNQVILRYCDQHKNVTAEANPNGSVNNIAGIVNKKGNVFGMMPHPERCSEKILGSDDGKLIFESIIDNYS